MKKIPSFLVASLLVAIPSSVSAKFERKTLEEHLLEISVPEKTEVSIPVNPSPVPQVLSDRKSKWDCPTCNENEKITLDFLQERGITDRAAIATVMGNIRQESNFIPNICEGGARVPYEQCLRGGFGIIQFTTVKRYNGLGNFSKRYGLNPSTLEAQLRWMVNEPEWTQYEPYLKGEGQSIEYYMRYAYNWLGWGIKGARTQYAYNYYNKLTVA